MIERLKRLWDFIGEPKFMYAYFFPGLSIFFFIGIITGLFIQTIDKDDLIKNEGTVVSIDLVFEQGLKPQYKYYPLKIRLDNSEKDFRLIDLFEEQFPIIKNKIQVGDKVAIFTRNRILTIIGFGKKDDIYHIEKNGQVIFDIQSMKQSKIKQIKHFAVLGSFFLILSILLKKIIKRKE